MSTSTSGWKALTQWQRDQIESIFMPTYFQTSRLHMAGVEEALQALKDEGGEVIHLSEEEVKRMRTKAINDIWPEIAEKSERNAKGVELWKEFMKDVGQL